MQILRRITGMIDELTSSTVGLIVFSLAVGIMIAMVFIMIQQYVVGGFVRKLLARGALSGDTAVTAEELGVRRNIFVLTALRMRESALRRVVFAAEQCFDANAAKGTESAADNLSDSRKKKKCAGQKTKEKKMKVRDAHWYIPMDKAVKAEALFGKERVNPVLLMIAVVILLVLMYFLIPAIPNVIELARAMLAA